MNTPAPVHEYVEAPEAVNADVGVLQDNEIEEGMPVMAGIALIVALTSTLFDSQLDLVFLQLA